MKIKLILITLLFASCYSCKKDIATSATVSSSTIDEANILKGGLVIFTADYDSKTVVHAVDAITGASKWIRELYDENLTLGGPCVANGMVFVVSTNPSPHVYALDAKKGVQIWKINLNENIYSASCPFYKDGYLYVASQRAIYKIDANTGAKIWYLRDPITSDNGTFNSPVVINETVYCNNNKKLYAVDINTGITKWADSSEYYYATSPCYINGNLYFAPKDNGLKCIDTLNHFRWTYPFSSTADGSSAPTFANNLIYTHTNYQNGDIPMCDVYAVNAKTGVQVWKYTLNKPPYYARNKNEFTNGKLVFVTAPDSLIALEAKTGIEAWSFKTPSSFYTLLSSPTSLGNAVYVSAANRIFAINTSTGAFLWEAGFGDTSGLENVSAPVILTSTGIAVHPAESGMTQ
ncbi:PQQ-binding-like beta-propeller repeat protein [Panacibacter ginsenosidivorans]|uniref:PQQ-binding-like beta-propeller repeat protein n=1 Tax=Panacibacter ginsenosidivorans TaxID=1813871 RepID=A0A5B8V9R9_9BACT|nr:PQQ-binding-like beta-propeller repeat protein [Panacibacter ginsenosidivorans]QEC67999.1 PQQ-binding-like beta-propeller repeat protein [Panacibacter ginsenosidivorans]